MDEAKILNKMLATLEVIVKEWLLNEIFNSVRDDCKRRDN